MKILKDMNNLRNPGVCLVDAIKRKQERKMSAPINQVFIFLPVGDENAVTNVCGNLADIREKALGGCRSACEESIRGVKVVAITKSDTRG